jgi:hypothetical protein
MKNNLLIICVFFLASCTSFKHTPQSQIEPTRVNEIANQVGLVANKQFAVDVRVDLDQIVTGSSANHPTAEEARNEAYYNCIVNNNVDLVVDPLYKSVEIAAPGIFKFLYKNKYKYEIRGFAGFYENPTDARNQALEAAQEELALKKAQLAIDKIAFEREDALFKMRGKNLNTLSKIGPSAKETKSSYMIESEKGCCPENNSNVVVNANSSGSGFGNVHLLHTSENQSSLVDEYLRLVCDGCEEEVTVSKPTIKSKKQSFSSDDSSGSSIFCKIPILKNFLCK